MNMTYRQPPRPTAQNTPATSTATARPGVSTPASPRVATPGSLAAPRPTSGPAAPVGRGGVPLTRPPMQQPIPQVRAQPNGGVRPGAPVSLSQKALSAKADELFMVMRQLCELLTKENTALKRYRADEVKALSERKDQLANLYHAHMATLSRDPSALKALDTGKRTVMIQMAARLAELMRDNASMLRANIRSIDTFFQAVTDAVREREEQKSASYSRAGVLNGYASVKRNLAVSYNRTT